MNTSPKWRGRVLLPVTDTNSDIQYTISVCLVTEGLVKVKVLPYKNLNFTFLSTGGSQHEEKIDLSHSCSEFGNSFGSYHRLFNIRRSSSTASQQRLSDPILSFQIQNQRLIPVVNPPNAIGWTNGEKPVAAEGMEVTAFASGLDHPRWLYVLPNGDVLVAESNAPADRPDDEKESRDGSSRSLEEGGRRRAQRGSYYAHAGCGRRWRCRDEIGIHRWPDLTVRDGVSGRCLLCSGYRCGCVVPLFRRRDGDHCRSHKNNRPAGRHDQPSLDQGPGRQCRWNEIICFRWLE